MMEVLKTKVKFEKHMKKEYNHNSHGNSPSELTNQQVHANTETNGHNTLFLNSKNKIMLKQKMLLTTLIVGFLTVVMVGCQKDDESILKEEQKIDVFSYTGISAKVINLSPEELVHLITKETDDPNLYFDIWNKVMTFSEEEYDIYFKLLLEKDVNELINRNVIDKSQKDQEIQAGYEQRRLYDEKALKEFGKLFYQLPFSQASTISDADQKEEFVTTVNIVNKASCSGYYYPGSVSNDGSGTNNCTGFVAARNVVDSDCDWEFIFNVGSSVFTAGKAKTTDARATAIFALGGVNYRMPAGIENPNTRRFLVGKGRINTAYFPSSGSSAASVFSGHIKFRGLLS